MIERNLSLDYLKVFLSFCIVALHSGFLGGLSTLNGYLFVNGFFRIAVPIFFMINGYFLYKNINNKNYIKEVIKHIFFMYIIWMVLYFPLYYSSYNFGSIKGIISFVFMLFNGYAHLWYLVSMIVSIIFIYLIRNINENQKLVIAIVIYLLGCAIDYISFLYSSNSIFFKIISNNYFTRNFFLWLSLLCSLAITSPI
jgi:surface polysaccharide O-acyltransferase-like enzyme